jgi:hypothetical protein
MAADSLTHVYGNVYTLPFPVALAHVYGNVGTGLPPQRQAFSYVIPPPAHIPHKNWASYEEERNYTAIERWSHILHLFHHPAPLKLHIPYRNWAAPQEEANYLAIERWALGIQTKGYKDLLHFPYKRWAQGQYDNSALEEDNYRYLESWSLKFSGYPGTAAEGVPPIYPNSVTHIYGNVV